MTLAQLMEQSGQDQSQIKGISDEEKEAMRRELEEQIRREMLENEQMASRMDSGSQWDNEVSICLSILHSFISITRTSF